jgi:hypothetical protein
MQNGLRPPLTVWLAWLLLMAGANLATPLYAVAAGAATAGAGHGLAFINAQQELNEIAPAERRGEVTSAFIACIYAMVAGSVIATPARRVVLARSVGRGSGGCSDRDRTCRHRLADRHAARADRVESTVGRAAMSIAPSCGLQG